KASTPRNTTPIAARTASATDRRTRPRPGGASPPDGGTGAGSGGGTGCRGSSTSERLADREVQLEAAQEGGARVEGHGRLEQRQLADAAEPRARVGGPQDRGAVVPGTPGRLARLHLRGHQAQPLGVPPAVAHVDPQGAD